MTNYDISISCANDESAVRRPGMACDLVTDSRVGLVVDLRMELYKLLIVRFETEELV